MTTSAHVGSRRILVVSNRLPITIQEKGNELEFVQSSGGLATGLGSLQGEMKTVWIGWPGSVVKERRAEVEARLVSEFGSYPVFLSEQLSERYYEGFSNRTIWPLFHSFPAYTKFSSAEWEAYQRANKLFAHKVLEVHQPGDILWIHDYHLMLLPKFLREELPDVQMGFFLHIPFPHYEIFRLLPQHKEILQSLLALDLIGFHIHDYAQAFLGNVRRSLGSDNSLGRIMIGDRVVQVDVFPMGIDFAKYSLAANDPALMPEINRIRESLRIRKTVFKVSRLDYTKGIPESLEGIREFFCRYPDWHGRIHFIIVVVPSRERVERYASLKREIDELVGQINSSYGTLDWTPIRYIYRSLTFGELIGLYAAADVALVSPLRDGMNLVAKEYLAVKNDGRGVLVLSEMAGAAKELLEAIIINPNSKEEIAEALHKALEMPEEEQVRRNEPMRQRLQSHDIRQWVGRFFERLRESVEASRQLSVRVLDAPSRQRLQGDYRRAQRRLIVLDYDGTLVPFADEPMKARPDAYLLSILRKLSSSPKNKVVLLSGRDRHTLEEWLGNTHTTLVAEHGGWMKLNGENTWTPTVAASEDRWKKEIKPLLDLYTERIPGSLVEEKDFSLVWHYRKAELESATLAARELLDTLSNMTSNLNVQVLPGHRTVEVRNIGISKGAFYTRFLAADAPEFILALGDDWTDEDLFGVLPETAYSIRVGLRLSKARFNVRSLHDVRSLLEQLEE